MMPLGRRAADGRPIPLAVITEPVLRRSTWTQHIGAPGLPKTRSGKIMRRILRKVAENELDNLGDTSTLADPSVVEQLIDARERS